MEAGTVAAARHWVTGLVAVDRPRLLVRAGLGLGDAQVGTDFAIFLTVLDATSTVTGTVVTARVLGQFPTFVCSLRIIMIENV